MRSPAEENSLGSKEQSHLVDRYEVLGSFFFRMYAFLWRLAMPVLRRKKRIKEGLAERLVPESWLPCPLASDISGHAYGTVDAEPYIDIWLQAASGGEVHLVTEILEAWVSGEQGAPFASSARPVRLLVTTWTLQGHNLLTQALTAHPEWAAYFELFIRYAPLDHPAIARRAVRIARPRVLALLETELWPGLLGACKESGVPVLVLNARMTSTSLELYKIIARPLRSCAPYMVEAVTREDASRFRTLFPSLGLDHCLVMPHIKFDRAFHSLQSKPAPLPAPFTPEFFASRAPVLLFASIRTKEEKRIAPALMQLRRLLPSQALIVIAPRHLARVPVWERRLHDLGFVAMRASACHSLTPPQPDPPRSLFDAFFAPLSPTPPVQVLLWDIFGCLPALYGHANLVFVGGSLAPLGGQNFLEALSAGRIPLIGPYTETFAWALTDQPAPSLATMGLVHTCAKPSHFIECLENELVALPDVPTQANVQERFAAWLKPRTGGSARAADVLKRFLGR